MSRNKFGNINYCAKIYFHIWPLLSYNVCFSRSDSEKRFCENFGETEAAAANSTFHGLKGPRKWQSHKTIQVVLRVEFVFSYDFYWSVVSYAFSYQIWVEIEVSLDSRLA